MPKFILKLNTMELRCGAFRKCLGYKGQVSPYLCRGVSTHHHDPELSHSQSYEEHLSVVYKSLSPVSLGTAAHMG